MDLLHPDWWVFRLNWWVAPIEKGGWHRLVDNTLRGGCENGLPPIDREKTIAKGPRLAELPINYVRRRYEYR